jgi:hypothetical protein
MLDELCDKAKVRGKTMYSLKDRYLGFASEGKDLKKGKK